MIEYKQTFVVLSKTKKENEKEDETKKTYSAFLRSETGQRINLHSESPIPLNIRDELEFKIIKHQSNLLIEDEEKAE